MGKIVAFLDRNLGRASGLYSFWPLAPAGLVAAVTGYLANGVAFIAKLGPFGWWSAALIAFVLSAAAFALLGYSRVKFVEAKAKRDWLKPTSAIDPMDANFNNKRISIVDIMHPMTNKCANKTFTDCDIIGPGNIVLANCHLSGVSFNYCDIVIEKGNVQSPNFRFFADCTFLRGTIAGCTIFVSQEIYEIMKQGVSGMEAITYERP